MLRLRGEREWRVEPLRLSPAGSGLAALASTPAVQMFVERVRDVRPGFELTEANAAVLTELCRRLDGLPLALELAASWMRLLNPDQVLERLDERMERPGRLGDLPDRQQTLSATLAWSYDLLPEPARQILVRLSVFAAPFTAESAEAVCGRDGTDVMESLATLFDHSMITPAERPDGERAFRLLELIRAFAAERLEDGTRASAAWNATCSACSTPPAPSTARRTGRGACWTARTRISPVLCRWAATSGRRPDPARLGDVWVWLLVRGNLRRPTALWQQVDPLLATRAARRRRRPGSPCLAAGLRVDRTRASSPRPSIWSMRSLPDARRR